MKTEQQQKTKKLYIFYDQSNAHIKHKITKCRVARRRCCSTHQLFVCTFLSSMPQSFLGVSFVLVFVSFRTSVTFIHGVKVKVCDKFYDDFSLINMHFQRLLSYTPNPLRLPEPVTSIWKTTIKKLSKKKIEFTTHKQIIDLCKSWILIRYLSFPSLKLISEMNWPHQARLKVNQEFKQLCENLNESQNELWFETGTEFRCWSCCFCAIFDAVLSFRYISNEWHFFAMPHWCVRRDKASVI